MAQGAAMRNGTPMRLVSPAPVLVQPQAASRQTTAAAASIYSSTQQNLYGANVNTSVNGGTLGGKFPIIVIIILLFFCSAWFKF